MRNFHKIIEGFQIGIGIFLSLAMGSAAISYGAATWGNLPQAVSGSGLTATMWNDLVSQSNGLAGAIQVNSGNVGIGTASLGSKLEVGGDAKISGVLTAGKVQMVDAVVANTACSPNGLIATDSSGALLSCRSGTWKSSVGSGMITGGCSFGSAWGTATSCGLSAGISCSAGNTARTMIYCSGGGTCAWNGSNTYAHGFCISN